MVEFELLFCLLIQLFDSMLHTSVLPMLLHNVRGKASLLAKPRLGPKYTVGRNEARYTVDHGREK